MPGGNLGPGIVLSLANGFNEIGDPDPDRRLIRVGAGAVAADVDLAARTLGLTLPCLPSSAEWCTVGGMAANNAAGAHSFGHGSVSRWIEEIEGVDAWGEPFHLTGESPDSGFLDRVSRLLEPAMRNRLPPSPAVRKNASGYGLDRLWATGNPLQLLIGSEGTLAIVTSVTLRLAPVPETRGVHLAAVDDPSQLAERAVQVADTGAVACEFLDRRLLEMSGLVDDPEFGPLARGSRALLLIEFEGPPDEVAHGLERARALEDDRPGDARTISTTDAAERRRLWSLRHRASPTISRQARHGRISTQFIEDSVVPPARLGDYVVGVERILDRAGFDAVIFGHAGDGNVHVNPLIDVGSPDWRPRVRQVLDDTSELVAELGGTLTGEHGDGRVRAPWLERVWGSEWAGLFHQVKDLFDPDRVLNPGVIIPEPGQDPLADLVPRQRSWPR